ncbi:erythrocyte membrane-associated antigen, partial [Plasmodium gaboni]
MKKQKDEEDEEEEEDEEKGETCYNKNLKNEFNKKIINKEEKYLNKFRISNILKCVNIFDKNVSVYEYENILKKMLIKKKDNHIIIKKKKNLNKKEKEKNDDYQNIQNIQNIQNDYMCHVNNNIIINTENQNYKHDINNIQQYINNNSLDYNYSNYIKIKNHNLLNKNERTKGYSSDSKIYFEKKKKIKYSRQKQKYKELPNHIRPLKGEQQNNKLYEEYVEGKPYNNLLNNVNNNLLYFNNISNINTSHDENFLEKEYITNTSNYEYYTDNNKKKRKQMNKILYNLEHLNKFHNSESNEHQDCLDNEHKNINQGGKNKKKRKKKKKENVNKYIFINEEKNKNSDEIQNVNMIKASKK